MSAQEFNQELPLKTRRSKRIVVNLSIALIAMAVHAFLQTMLGSFVAGLPVNGLPQTTLTTLVLLNFVFLTMWSGGFAIQWNCISTSGKIFGQLASCLPRFCSDSPHIPDALQ